MRRCAFDREGFARGFVGAVCLLAILASAMAFEARAEPAWRGYLGSVSTFDGTAGGALRGVHGELTDFAWPYLVPPKVPFVGTYGRGAVPGADLRSAPLALGLTGERDEALEASARAVFEPRRVDLTTGRPLRSGAPPGAACTTGAEPDCLAPGDAPVANRAAFDALCDTTRGSIPIDGTTCALLIYRSQAQTLPGVTAAMVLSILLSGSPAGINLTANPAFAGPAGPLQRAPLVALSIDRGDGAPTGFAATNAVNSILNFRSTATGGVPDLAGNHNMFQTLAQVLTPEQQALLGCGPYHGTQCDGGVVESPYGTSLGGIHLLQADAGALLQSFAPLGDESFLATDASRPQPGTVGSPAPACDHGAPGAPAVLLPGCRGPGDPGYEASKDGPDPVAAGIGFPAGLYGVPALGSPTLGPVSFAQGHPFTGQAWRSEMAALSWNLQTLHVLLSLPAASPELSDPRYGFDAANAFRSDGCSYAKPQLCSGVIYMASQALDVLANDPHGRPSKRWAWEYGARYSTESATGRFADLAGGDLFVFGPAAPAGATHDAFLATVPVPDADADGDGIKNSADRCPATADPLQTDNDNDGIGDACDDCTAVANRDQRDTNGDGIGNACDADLDGNGVVNFADLARLKSVFFGSDANADLDGNGVVNFADLARMKQRFFQPPGPSALAP